jgi:peptidoglycan-N-acetylglucosamine deacetylase
MAQTEGLVNYLKAQNIKATFFLIANNITVKSLKQYNHPLFELGLHSYKHNDFRKYTPEQIINDFENCRKIIFDSFKLNMPYYRPPYGIINSTIAQGIKNLNQQGVLWNIDSQDWNKLTGDDFIKNIDKGLCQGSIILMHDIVSLVDLKNLVNHLREQQYQIVSLKELMQFPNAFIQL